MEKRIEVIIDLVEDKWNEGRIRRDNDYVSDVDEMQPIIPTGKTKSLSGRNDERDLAASTRRRGNSAGQGAARGNEVDNDLEFSAKWTETNVKNIKEAKKKRQHQAIVRRQMERPMGVTNDVDGRVGLVRNDKGQCLLRR